MGKVTILQGDCLERLQDLEDESVHCVVTSPPYWGLRDYGVFEWVGADPDCKCEAKLYKHRTITDDKQSTNIGARSRTQDTCVHCGATKKTAGIGLEPTFQQHVDNLLNVFDEVRRVLRPDGTLWLNYGDAYSGSGGAHASHHANPGLSKSSERSGAVLSPKNLMMMPSRIAMALQERGVIDLKALQAIERAKELLIESYEDVEKIPDKVRSVLERLEAEYIEVKGESWYLRSEIIWYKPNPMPESVTDRPTAAHEKIFLFTKNPRYFYDAEAVSIQTQGIIKKRPPNRKRFPTEKVAGMRGKESKPYSSVNLRNVWSVTVHPYQEAHFATFPAELIEPCIKAGTSEKGCCPECGAPWERVMMRSVSFESGSGRSGNKIEGKYSNNPPGEVDQTKSGNYDIRRGPVVSVKTLGWRPTCDCYDDEYRKFPKPKKMRKKLQRMAWHRGWWARVRARPGLDSWPVDPALVIDPFGGSGTTALVANKLGRDAVLVELNPEYVEMARDRIEGELGSLFTEISIDTHGEESKRLA